MPKRVSEPKIDSLDKKADEQVIATGIKKLDDLLGGGIYRGRITELWGAEALGKTYLTTKIMANLSKDYKILYVDAEYAFNKARAAELGVELKNVDYLADSQLERVCEGLIKALGKYDVIFLDSLAYLTPVTIDTNEIGETSIGLFARLIKHWVVKFRPRLGTSKTAMVVVNQYRAVIGYTRPNPMGGEAWKHAVDTRLFLSSNSADKILEGGKQVGHQLHLKVVKSKTSTPFKETKLAIRY